ncbi:MAG: M50 family metallopeptidase [Verrucomicrobiota bacterium]
MRWFRDHKSQSQDDENSYQWLNFPFSILFLSIYGAIDFGGGFVSLAHFVFFLLSVLVWIVVIVALHEFGHVVVARLFRMKVMGITIGEGRTLAEFSLLGLNWTTKAYPFCGCVTYYHTDKKNWKTKEFLITLAGPAMEALVIILLGSYFWLNRNELNQQELIKPFVTGFLFCAVTFLLINLFSMEGKIDGKVVKTDIANLLTIFSRDDREVNEQVAVCYYLDNWRDAQHVVQQNYHQLTPVLESVLTWQCFIDLTEASTIANALRVLVKSSDESENDTKLVNLDSFCTWAIFLGDRKYFQEAGVYSEKLYEIFPEDISVNGSRGSLLIMNGQLDQGMDMLSRVYETSTADFDKTISAAFIAWAYHLKGQKAEAKVWLEKSSEYTDGKWTIDWIGKQLTC